MFLIRIHAHQMNGDPPVRWSVRGRQLGRSGRAVPAGLLAARPACGAFGETLAAFSDFTGVPSWNRSARGCRAGRGRSVLVTTRAEDFPKASRANPDWVVNGRERPQPSRWRPLALAWRVGLQYQSLAPTRPVPWPLPRVGRSFWCVLVPFETLPASAGDGVANAPVRAGAEAAASHSSARRSAPDGPRLVCKRHLLSRTSFLRSAAARLAARLHRAGDCAGAGWARGLAPCSPGVPQAVQYRQQLRHQLYARELFVKNGNLLPVDSGICL